MKSLPSSLDPSAVAEHFIAQVVDEIQILAATINVTGLIATHDRPSLAYARATKNKFENAGINYELQNVPRLELEDIIRIANENSSVHGIFIYFPIFNNEHDIYLRNQVDYRKDVEAGSHYWTQKLYANDRLALAGDQNKKALLPCTPLAIVKMLTGLGLYATDVARPIEGKTVSIFNRSEVNGRPLAVMMSNDGARVYSFDVNGPLLFKDAKPYELDITRAQALIESDIVITGVPNANFRKIACDEIKSGAVCVNFSALANFEDNIEDQADIYIPRVGPLTVAMCMRNTLRLYNNFHLATDYKAEP